MNKLKIAIIDCIGLNYDGTTLKKKGIGGSESSIISIAVELVKLGFDVSIFNDCDSEETKPGIYDGVTYRPIRALGLEDYGFDIVISQRTLIPFTPLELYNEVRQPAPRDYDPAIFAQVQKPNQLKILWQQDTFIWGDHILEKLLVEKHLDEVFNISDWHISYTSNSTHGPRRNFEVLKNKIFSTRNAINRWIDWVDIKQKDPNLFVYNASITKGMIPLVTKIWPKIKQRLPNARLKVIGGYYKFRNEIVSEAQQKVIDLMKSVEHDTSIEFTGIIPQPKIAEIMAQASYNLYPGAYPETSGISTIESINYNTPIIGTRFGAMEESGTDAACYFIDYAIEPNGLFPWINTDWQIDRYVNLVLGVVSNPYLHQQKQYACNAAKDISTWDTVALQWKQHFYSVFDLELAAEEKERADWINYRVHKVFGRRIINAEEIIVPAKPTDPVLPLVQRTARMAIIDIVGMAYDGATLSRKGMGGSESAVILVSKELAKIGIDVTVYNACDEEDYQPGVYDGVTYKPLSEIKNDPGGYDIVVSSRVVTPFITEPWYGYPQTTNRKFDYEDFKRIRETAKLKVFWMHDTFCWGDDILEDLVVHGPIDEIWTLSDFHAMYVMNCSHPKMRNYEVLRRHMWTTRNGIVKYFDSVDLDAKDLNMYIFNANMSKGLAPLLNDVWPRVKERLPDARLTVIGGHYKLGAAFAHADEESEFMKIAGPSMDDPTITFTGIVPQKTVAELSAKAGWFIYPASLPETYGISTVEALYANTPLLTCRFGALEETSTDNSYLIDYAITPNGLFPNINPQLQVEKFVDMVVDAAGDLDEYRRRQLALNDIKDLVGWDVTALEWKQHIYSKIGLYLSKEEAQQVNYTKSKYHKVFGRRYSTPEEWLAPKQRPEQKIVIISPFYNAANYIESCIASVAAQDYDNYLHILIDDASTDDGYDVAEKYIDNLPNGLSDHFMLVSNPENRGAVYNHITTIRDQDPDAIIMLLDGDDSLVNQPDILTYYNRVHCDADFTYGSCWSMVDSIPLVSQPYPPEVKSVKAYKDYRFNWNMPYTHLRTFKARLVQGEPDNKFQDSEGNWFKAGGDNATFYSALSNCESDKVYVVSDIVYNYNDISPINDYKVNKDAQDRAIATIVGKIAELKTFNPVVEMTQPSYNKPKRILIAVPTNRNIEATTFKSIYDLIIPDGYTVDFQYFWGYQVDQVRNLIAHWGIQNGYDYIFSVDSDISFAPDTLAKMLSHNKDIVSGVYIQRIPGRHCIELMRKNAHGGVTHVDWSDIKGQGLVPIDGCGFGCVLVKIEVYKAIPYPHFLYHSAIDHSNTLSEDVHFCNQARDRGFTMWADTDIICDHTGSWTFKVDMNMPARNPVDKILLRLKEIRHAVSMPEDHRQYLSHMKNALGINPKVVYDIGASTLHWYDSAKIVWSNADYIAFDGMVECAALYEEAGVKYAVNLLSDKDHRELYFYENKENPAGNSYYRENVEFSPAAQFLYDDAHRVKKLAKTLDTVVKENGFPMPDLIKLDIQGAEVDVLQGAKQVLKHCANLIVEIQEVEYNKGAPLKQEVIDYLESIGFDLVGDKFSGDHIAGDYHFTRK
jgi:FkbM family methyltransferase